MTMERMNNALTFEDMAVLELAVRRLDNPSFIARLADMIGTPIEQAVALLPAKATERIGAAANKALLGSLKLAVKTMDHHDRQSGPPPASSDWWHKGAAVLSGGIGGFFGIAALLIELPISTTIIMRSIADVARSEGENLNEISAQLECVKVFAFGGPAKSDDGAEVGYFAAREALAKATADAAAYIGQYGLGKDGAPALVRLILVIAERYSIPVTAKAAAQLIPAIGAAGGALVNSLFTDHFQDVAHGHFAVRRLEEKYGTELVRKEYGRVQQAHKLKAS